MATLNFSLAWSVPVPVEMLGAHLQAYVQLQPNINTLRLCNRYGRGSKVAINKLPVELIGEVETYLVEEEREKQRSNWTKDFTCFQGLCKPLDHLSDSEQVGLWQDFFEDCDFCGGCKCRRALPPKVLSDSQQDALESVLRSVADEDGMEEMSWWVEHQNRSSRWEGKTGSPNDQGRGLLSRYSALLSRNFGLEIWVTHTQPKKAMPGQFTATDVYVSTSAYLTLPCSNTRETFDRGMGEDRAYQGLGYVATESGGGALVVPPGPISTVDVLRFSRAIKALTLDPHGCKDTVATVYASTKDREASEKRGDDATAESSDGKDWTPKLRILYSQAVAEGL